MHIHVYFIGLFGLVWMTETVNPIEEAGRQHSLLNTIGVYYSLDFARLCTINDSFRNIEVLTQFKPIVCQVPKLLLLLLWMVGGCTCPRRCYQKESKSKPNVASNQNNSLFDEKHKQT